MQSTHRSFIIKRIPCTICKQLSHVSSDKDFDKAAPIYNEALETNGFNETLKFSPTILTRRYRRRNFIRLNI